MAEVASAYVSLLPSFKGGAAAISREIDGPVTKGMADTGKKAGKGFGKSFGGAASGFIKAAAGLAIAQAGVNFLKDSVTEAREAQKVGATTEQIIKSTGGTAKVTAKQVGDLATAISLKTGKDDEAIQTGANLLLTFKNVRNEVGKGNDIFNRATQAATDLSAAGFGDLNGAAKQLGKALNDPVKGMSALGRAGVTFTNDQKAMIKALVEGGDAAAAVAMGLVDSAADYSNLLKANKGDGLAVYEMLTKDLTPAQKKQFDFLAEGNHTLDAQKIILKEVESQVGGTAAASATAGEKMAVAWGNFQEAVGTSLLPVIDKLMVALTGVFGWLSQNQPVLIALGVLIGGTLVAAMVAWTASIWASTVALLANPVTWIVLGIIALVAALVLLFKNWDKVAAWIKQVWGKVVTWLRGVWENIVTWVKSAWERTLSTIRNVQVQIGTVILNAWNKVTSFFSTVKERIVSAFSTAWDFLKRVWGWTPYGLIINNWGKILDFFKGLPGRIGSFLGGLAAKITSPFRAAFNSVARLWNGTIGKLDLKIPGWVPGIGGKGFSFPKLPQLAAGGVAVGPTLALIGEGSEPEAVVPLSKLESMLGSRGPQIVVNGDVKDPWTMADIIDRRWSDAMTVDALNGVGS